MGAMKRVSKAQQRREAKERRRRAKVEKRIAVLEDLFTREANVERYPFLVQTTPDLAQELVALWADRDHWDAPKPGEQLTLGEGS